MYKYLEFILGIKDKINLKQKYLFVFKTYPSCWKYLECKLLWKFVSKLQFLLIEIYTKQVRSNVPVSHSQTLLINIQVDVPCLLRV